MPAYPIMKINLRARRTYENQSSDRNNERKMNKKDSDWELGERSVAAGEGTLGHQQLETLPMFLGRWPSHKPKDAAYAYLDWS